MIDTVLTFRAREDEFTELRKKNQLYREIILRLEEENQKLRDQANDERANYRGNQNLSGLKQNLSDPCRDF